MAGALRERAVSRARGFRDAQFHVGAQLEGVARARKEGRYKGTAPKIYRAAIARLRSDGKNVTQIARALSISRESVYRIEEGDGSGLTRYELDARSRFHFFQGQKNGFLQVRACMLPVSMRCSVDLSETAFPLRPCTMP